MKQSGAHSSDLLHAEDVDTLCDKCVDFADAWAPEAERIWTSTTHRDTHTQYYRDTPEGKAEFGCTGGCAGCAAACAAPKKTDKADNTNAENV